MPLVKVPHVLLLDTNLSASSKLLWMVAQLHPLRESGQISRRFLRERSGLAWHTVVRGQAQLESACWLTDRLVDNDETSRASTLVPSELLLECRIGILARFVYGILQTIAGSGVHTGEFTYAELSRVVGVRPNALKQAIQALQEHGWLRISQRNKFSPVYFTLHNPAAERGEQAVADLEQRLEEASFLGEALMRAYLSLLVDSDEYDDNASPGFLVNPYTGEEMQFDRYYPPRVAFEFNGPQHYGPTARYTNEMDARKQQGRDYIKMGICVRREIRLVIVHPEDLALATMQRKVGGLLPLRYLEGQERLLDYLESVSRAYRRKARKGLETRPGTT